MVEFIKKVETVLPYDREKYIDTFDSDLEYKSDWLGLSFQVAPENDINLQSFCETYGTWFKYVVQAVDDGSKWIINHDDKDLVWLPNHSQSLSLLRSIFKQNNISEEFKGALRVSTDELLRIWCDLLLYPYHDDGYLYKNLDISHSNLSFIIKITGHLCIDLLSTDRFLLKKIVNDSASYGFIVKEYRGTSL